jgi:hypothetical protein
MRSVTSRRSRNIGGTGNRGGPSRAALHLWFPPVRRAAAAAGIDAVTRSTVPYVRPSLSTMRSSTPNPVRSRQSASAAKRSTSTFGAADRVHGPSPARWCRALNEAAFRRRYRPLAAGQLTPQWLQCRGGSYFAESGTGANGQLRTLALGFRNRLDTAPPVSNPQPDFQVGIDPGYGGPRGRMLQGTIRHVFRRRRRARASRRRE